MSVPVCSHWKLNDRAKRKNLLKFGLCWNYFLANEHCFPLTINQHKPNFSISEHGFLVHYFLCLLKKLTLSFLLWLPIRVVLEQELSLSVWFHFLTSPLFLCLASNSTCMNGQLAPTATLEFRCLLAGYIVHFITNKPTQLVPILSIIAK
jgi:hypothetical protein